MSPKSLRFGVAAGLLAFGACWLYVTLRAPYPGGWAARVARQAVRPPTRLAWAAYLDTRGGDGLAGFADGAPARFADPYGLAMDGEILYVADGGDNNRIRVIGADGVTGTLAGGREGFADGQGAQAAFHTPSAIALDRDGSLIVADTGNHAIRRVTQAGLVSTVAGTGEPGYADGPGAQARFDGPVGVAVDKQGNIFVADTYNDRIRRIAPDGTVTTVAGGGPGLADGPGAAARFDTPCGVAVDAHGALFVADTGNGAVRRIGADGVVGTLASAGLLRRPLGLAFSHDGVLHVADMGNGRIVQIGAGGVQHALTDAAAGSGDLRLRHPSAVALGPDGVLYVAEAARHVVRRLAPQPPAGPRPALLDAPPPFPVAWPVHPAAPFHEIVGTMGEVRGNYSGVARDHFHGGLDVQAEMGVPVQAVARGKVGDPLAAWGAGSLGEGLALDRFNYIHMRVGRDARDAPFDPARFAILRDAQGPPARVRVRRGARFEQGDRLGTVNRMYHVHLEYVPGGAKVNPLTLPWQGYRDTLAPVIEAVTLVDGAQQPLPQAGGQTVLDRAAGPFGLVVEAYDRIDGNAVRRRLGLYRLGYQLLRADGAAVAGYEQPRFNIAFDQLPLGDDAVTVAYAERSGITVHGSAQTRFLYVPTNTVRGGQALPGVLDVAGLAPGEYVLRITAQDQAGNEAGAKRALRLRVL